MDYREPRESRDVKPIDDIQRQQLPCGCVVLLAVQQEQPCRHNDGRYAYHDIDVEQTPCGCEEGCDRCNGHLYVYKRRFWK